MSLQWVTSGLFRDLPSLPRLLCVSRDMGGPSFHPHSPPHFPRSIILALPLASATFRRDQKTCNAEKSCQANFRNCHRVWGTPVFT